tara:strand:+ start:1468 stop:1899 length:432 start_codon:yes stop_codon:yes gene_type:complete
MLEHHGETPCGLQLRGLLHQPLLAAWIFGLTAITKAVHGLWQQTQMPHHGDAGANQPFNHCQHLRFGTLQLHAGSAGLLDQGSCCSHRSIQPALVAEEGKISDHKGLFAQRLAQASADRLGVHQHLLQGDRQGCAVAKADHGE